VRAATQVSLPVCDPLPPALQAAVGGPPGRSARPPRRATAVQVLLVLAALTCVLGYAQKVQCRDTRMWQHEYQYTHLCYTDVVALWGSEGLDKGSRPFLDHAVEYPVLIGAAMQLAAPLGQVQQPAHLAPAGYTQDEQVARFFDATALLLAAAALVTVACTALTAGRRPWDAALVAVAPALLLHAFTNWDLLAVAAASGGLLAWSRRAPRLAGLLLGLGIATKAYPVLLLLALLPLCLRAGRLHAWARAAVTAAVTVLAVYVPVYLLAGYGSAAAGAVTGPSAWSAFWGGNGLAGLAAHHGDASNALLRFFALNSSRPADWDSLPYALQYLSGAHSITPVGLRVVLVLVAAAAVLGMAFVLRRSRRVAAGVLVVGAAAVLALALVSGRVVASGATGFPVQPLNAVSAVACGLLLSAVAVLALRAPVPPRVPQVALLAVIAFLLTNKVYSPQYALWLLPLVALARPRWGMFLVWQLTEALVLLTRLLYFVSLDTTGRAGIVGGWFVAAVLVRDLVLAVIAGLVVRDVLRPEHDIVRAAGVDDPSGGVLRGPERPRADRRPAEVLVPG